MEGEPSAKLSSEGRAGQAKRGPALTALYVWGHNARGQTSHSAGVSGDPATWRCQRVPFPLRPDAFRGAGKRGRGAGKRPPPSFRVLDVACGLEHTAAVGSDGSIFTWGRNDYGQLGDGSEDDRRQPKQVQKLRNEHVTAVACGARFSAAISDSLAPESVGPSEPSHGRLWVWGENQNSNLPRLFLGAFPPKTAVRLVSCGASHAAAVSETGLLQTWGYNEVGQLGWGITCEGLQPARLVSHFMRHLDDAPIPSVGALPVAPANLGSRGEGAIRIVGVACGDYHTAAVDANGDLYTWGWGLQGQLGHRALQSGQGTRELMPRRVVALEGQRMAQVACGRTHTCAITTSGALYVWGGGREGQLGTALGARGRGSTRAGAGLGSDGEISTRLQQGGVVAAAALEEIAAASLVLRLPVLLMPRGIVQVACGTDHTLAVTHLGELLGWGYNSCGQAVSGHQVYAWQPTRIDWCVGRVRRIAAGGGHTAVLTEAASLRDMCEFELVRLTLAWARGAPAGAKPEEQGADDEASKLAAMSHAALQGLFPASPAHGPVHLLDSVIETAERLHSLSLSRFCALHRDRMLSGRDWDLESMA